MKSKYLISLGCILIITGCIGDKGLVVTKLIHTPCPKFLYTVDIEVHDYNETHATVSKIDVIKLVKLSKKKEQFNKVVFGLNNNAEKQILKQ